MKWSLTTNLHILETDIFKLYNPNSGYLLLDFCKEIEIHVVWKSILRYQFHWRGLFPLDSKWELLCEKFFLKTQPRISSIKFNTFLCTFPGSIESVGDSLTKKVCECLAKLLCQASESLPNTITSRFPLRIFFCPSQLNTNELHQSKSSIHVLRIYYFMFIGLYSKCEGHILLSLSRKQSWWHLF